MKKILYVILLFLSPFAIMAEMEYHPDGGPEKVRIGVYDSRVVAFAYIQTDTFNNKVLRLNALRDSAFSKRDRALLIGIERTINGLKSIYYKKIYSTYPVDDILATVSDKVAEIAADAHVKAIVSKWNTAFIGNDVELVDLTKELAVLFADSAMVNALYPPEGISDPKPLIDAEGFSTETGFHDKYGLDQFCYVEKKNYQSQDMKSRFVGLWRASEVHINGQIRPGMLNWYWQFNENGVIEVEEFRKYISDGEWIIGLSENALILKLTDEKKSFTGRYDFKDDILIVSGKGYVDPLDNVCIVLKKVNNE